MRLLHFPSTGLLPLGVALLLAGCYQIHGAGPLPRDAALGPRDARVSTDAGLADAGPTIDSGVPDAGIPLDLCAPTSLLAPTCDDSCPADGPDFYAWNGYQCTRFGVCDLPFFDRIPTQYVSLAACGAATRECDANLCLRTGGRWLPELEYCGHHQCGGRPNPPICESGTSACACGVQRYFVPGEGCREAIELCDDATVPELCRESGGTWDCPVDDPGVCGMACECQPGRLFVFPIGCMPNWELQCSGGPGFDRCTSRPSVEGTPCDPRAPLCADGLTCCATGRRSGPVCARPCACGAE